MVLHDPAPLQLFKNNLAVSCRWSGCWSSTFGGTVWRDNRTHLFLNSDFHSPVSNVRLRNRFEHWRISSLGDDCLSE
jgi:hypothetical protein